jgi:ribosomal protein S12 methylthiotransferase accessory factor
MDMVVTFPGGKKVDAEFNGFTIKTDQPVYGGGDGSAPAPFDLFLGSLATCAGIYILGFCQQRGLPTENIKIIQKIDYNSARRMIDKINLEIQVPAEIPEKYHAALIRSAELCAVKRHLQEPPAFDIYTKVVGQ